MDREKMLRLEEFRRTEAGPLEGTLIDEFVDGDMDRSTFIRRASVLGLSMRMIGAGPRRVGGRRGRGVGPPPVPGLDPHTYKDTGGLVTGGIAGEFLTRATESLTLLPELALSWKPNNNASSW